MMLKWSALLFLFLMPQATLAGVDMEELEESALTTLVDLIKLDTSQPAGNEIIAARYLAERLSNAGIKSEIIESAPGRASIIARLVGNQSKPPILLLGHTDVVTVEPENWSFDPFSGTVSEGKIFGRGAADDKGIVAASVEVLLALKQNNIKLDRDVIFLGVADEEAGGILGITYLVENHLDKIAAEFAINEGGRGYFDNDTGNYVSFEISTAEKTPRRARLVAQGRAGHGSVPTIDNPVGLISRAVARLFENPLPMELNETTRAFFTRMAMTRPHAEAEVYRAILAPDPGIEVQEQLRSINPSFYSIIRTSVVPTIIQGGYQRNVIPSSAEATLDIRALPGTDPEVLFDQIGAIIDDEAVSIEPMAVTRPAHLPSSLDTALFKAFEKVISDRHPTAVVLPNMLTGATDSAQLRAAGIPSYGFGPGLALGENNGIHGNDEYLRVDAYQEYVRLLWLVVNEVAASGT